MFTGLRIRWILLLIPLVLLYLQPPAYGQIYNIYNKEDWDSVTRINKEKIDTHLPRLMREHNIDMWIIMSREANEDPLMVNISGRWGHRCAYIFYDTGGVRVEFTRIGTHTWYTDYAGLLTNQIVYNREGLKPHLKKFVEEHNPSRIGVNISRTIPMADGLTVAMRDYLVDAIGDKYASRLVSAESLTVAFRRLRVPEEHENLKKATEKGSHILYTAFHDGFIQPGKTTAEDLYWHIIELTRKEGLDYSFEPLVMIRRPGLPTSSRVAAREPLKPGDIICIDYGIIYRTLTTDMKRTAYILKKGEQQPPREVKKAIEDAFKARDAFSRMLKPGRTGIELDEEAHRWLKQNNINGAFYSHSTGNFVHGIGTWTGQHFPDRYGDRVFLPIVEGEHFSLEYHVLAKIPGFSEPVSLPMEDSGYITGDGLHLFPQGKMSEIWLVKSEP